MRLLEHIAWLRVVPGLTLLTIGLMFCVILTLACCCYSNSERRSSMRNLNERLPALNLLLQQQSRAYNPEKDNEVETCIICLENFAESPEKLVAELNCSNKHIFHLDCLRDWVH